MEIMADKLKYFGLEPAGFTGDADFVTMTTEQRGAYCSIIFYLYQNDGKLKCQSDGLAIAPLCGCYGEWMAVWDAIKDKFKIEHGYITHARVTKEIERAKKFRLDRQNAGKLGAAKRWPKDSLAMPKDTLRKDTINKYSQDSNEIRLAKLLFTHIQSRKADVKQPNFQVWAKHIDRMIRLDKRTPEKIEKVINWCQQDSFWQNNILGTVKLRKQFDRLELQAQNFKQIKRLTEAEKLAIAKDVSENGLH